MNVAIITGASSGMGREAAKQIDKIYTNGISEIWLIARREDRLKVLASELSHKVRILKLDLTDEKDLQELDLSLNLINPDVKILVNASGYGMMGPFKTSKCSEQTGMIRLNCESLTRVTHMVLKYMQRGARIVQFASAAAFVPQTDFSVYAATKAFVLSFSRSLNEELRRYGISVTAVCPGPVNTEFFDIAEQHNANFNFKKYFMSKADKVVRKALADAYHRKAVSVYSLSMNAFRLLMKVFPHSLVLKVMSLLQK